MLVAVVGLTVVSALSLNSTQQKQIAFSTFTEQVADGKIKSVTWNNVDQSITGTTKSGENFVTTGPALGTG